MAQSLQGQSKEEFRITFFKEQRIMKTIGLASFALFISGLTLIGCGFGSENLSLLKEEGTKTGYTTEHTIDGGTQTHCGQKMSQLSALEKDKGLYYAAANFKTNGFKCGDTFQITITGGCIGGITKCSEVALSKYNNSDTIKNEGSRTFKVIIADKCDNCGSNHFDVGNYFYSNSSVGKKLNSVLNAGSLPKNDNGDTPDRKNFKMKYKKLSGCVSLRSGSYRDSEIGYNKNAEDYEDHYCK